MDDFLTFVLRDADAYWSGVWAAAGYPNPQVTYVFPQRGESVPDPCSKTRYSDDSSAHYCALDDRITISQAKAVDLWLGRARANSDPDSGQSSGDFSVAYAVAHEYAHSLQAELDIIPSAAGQVRRFPTYMTELHADCWAGVWANSAYYQGLLEPGDVEEGIQAANLLGDYAFADPKHHGTPAQRRQAFLTGYHLGAAQECDRYLST
jgi:predicted metalloprotease